MAQIPQDGLEAIVLLEIGGFRHPKPHSISPFRLKSKSTTYQLTTTNLDSILSNLHQGKKNGKLIINIHLGGIGGIEFEEINERHKIDPKDVG